jgi:hypothetical protein
MNALIQKNFACVTGVTATPRQLKEAQGDKGGNQMVSTRLASPCTATGFQTPDRRDRVDPVKLLGLIRRIKAASGTTLTPKTGVTAKSAAKAG